MKLRAALANLPKYIPGRPPAARPGLTTYKISSNENPYAPLRQIVDAAQQAVLQMNRYPDMGVTELHDALASRFDVPAAHIGWMRMSTASRRRAARS